MNEEETRNRLIRPSIINSGWTDQQIREEYPYTMGRIHVSGKTTKRGEKKKVDFLLEYRPNLPLAIIEAKHSNKDLGIGMQQALVYAKKILMCLLFSLQMEMVIFSMIEQEYLK